MNNKYYYILILLVFVSCGDNTNYKTTLDDSETFRLAVKKLTDVIVHDIFSPPVASRIYAYPCIAAYEILAKNDTMYQSLVGQLNGLSSIPNPENDKINFKLAAFHSFFSISSYLIFSEEKITNYQDEFYKDLEINGLPYNVKIASITYGDLVAKHILNWVEKDLYKQTRTYPRYTIKKETKYWKPTPPDYMNGIEPHWNKIRTLVLDSAQQFKPIDPVDFSLEEDSEFYRQLKEVYDIGVNLSDEQKAVAKFWDCNPYVSHHYGHAMFATKKITPGGHWIGITAIASRKANSDFMQTVEAYTKVSIALFDAFISCWDEKWRSIIVRPETLINEYMDEDWVPLLQTPPFPEYTSGHSVISRAAALMLTDLYGDNFVFNDTTEVEYGLPARKFNSFIEASEEAAISRLYGGIHYMMACENGVEQGQRVGEYIVEKLDTRINDFDSTRINQKSIFISY